MNNEPVLLRLSLLFRTAVYLGGGIPPVIRGGHRSQRSQGNGDHIMVTLRSSMARIRGFRPVKEYDPKVDRVMEDARTR